MIFLIFDQRDEACTCRMNIGALHSLQCITLSAGMGSIDT
jgi:hypothetical protein